MKKFELSVLLVIFVSFIVSCGQVGSTNVSGSKKLSNVGRTAVVEAPTYKEFTLIKDIETFKQSLETGVDAVETILHLYNALYMYEIDDKIADEMVKQVIDKNRLGKGGAFLITPGEGIRIIKSDRRIVRSYFGAVPPDYDIEITDKFTVTFKLNKTQDMDGKGRRLKYFVDSKGKDFDTPITLIQQDGAWKINEFSSVYTGVRREPVD